MSSSCTLWNANLVLGPDFSGVEAGAGDADVDDDKDDDEEEDEHTGFDADDADDAVKELFDGLKNINTQVLEFHSRIPAEFGIN